MAASTIGMLFGLKSLVVFGAFLVMLFFAVLLYRANVPGSRWLVAGGAAILLGTVLGANAYSLGGIALWPSYLLDVIGAVAAAYGFARVARATIRNLKDSRHPQ